MDLRPTCAQFLPFGPRYMDIAYAIVPALWPYWKDHQQIEYDF